MLTRPAGPHTPQVRIRVFSKMLLKVAFFKDLTLGTRETLGAFLQVEYFAGGRQLIFEQGAVADKFYIIVDGKVGVYRRPDGHGGAEECLATYSTHARRPTFGELALWSSKPRAGSARALEPTTVLVVHAADFDRFLRVVPEFTDVFETYATAYDNLNRIKAEHEKFGRVIALPKQGTLNLLSSALGSMLKQGQRPVEGAQGAGDSDSDDGDDGGDSSSPVGHGRAPPARRQSIRLVPLSRAFVAWERIVRKALHDLMYVEHG